MYIRKEIREFLKKMPKEMKLPKHWKKFVNDNSKEYNLLIKHGKEYECTNCGKYFYSEQVEGDGESETDSHLGDLGRGDAGDGGFACTGQQCQPGSGL